MDKQLNKMVKQVVGSNVTDFEQLIGNWARSIALILVEGRDVALFFKPPALVDLNVMRQTLENVKHQDWTALPPPTGYHWELYAAPGTRSRYDVFDRLAKVSIHGQAVQPREPDETAGERVLFRVPLGVQGEVKLWRDKTGNVDVEALAEKDLAHPPALDLFDEENTPIGVLRMPLLGHPRFDLAHSLRVIQEGLKHKRAVVDKAAQELKDAEDNHKLARLKGKSEGKQVSENEWTLLLRSKCDLLKREQSALGLLTHLERRVIHAQHQLTIADLVKNGTPQDQAVDSNEAMSRKTPFAGQWLLDQSVLVSLYQDADGTIAGTYTDEVVKEVPQVTALLHGQATGRTMAFLSIRPILGNNSRVRQLDELHGRFVLSADGLGAEMFIGKERAARGRLQRLGVGLASLGWFQPKSGQFEGYWIHPNQKNSNTYIKKNQAGWYAGNNEHGKILG
jgi:hypothetical protein